MEKAVPTAGLPAVGTAFWVWLMFSERVQGMPYKHPGGGRGIASVWKQQKKEAMALLRLNGIKKQFFVMDADQTVRNKGKAIAVLREPIGGDHL